jgi:hypothetical protein
LSPVNQQIENRAKYPFICAWGARLGSFMYYVDAEISRAIEDGAPARAIYKSGSGEWRTIDDCANSTTKEECEAWVAKTFKIGDSDERRS